MKWLIIGDKLSWKCINLSNLLNHIEYVLSINYSINYSSILLELFQLFFDKTNIAVVFLNSFFVLAKPLYVPTFLYSQYFASSLSMNLKFIYFLDQLSISFYKTWYSICEIDQNLKSSNNALYLQWHPLVP